MTKRWSDSSEMRQQGRAGKPLHSVWEYYTEIDELIRLLRVHGGGECADALHLLLHETAWTTGDELVGELDLVLARTRGRFPAEIRKKLGACRRFAFLNRHSPR